MNKKALQQFAKELRQIASLNKKADAASVAGGALNGAATGAEIGSMIPGVGTAIGAGVGAIAGGLSGMSSDKKELTMDKEEMKKIKDFKCDVCGGIHKTGYEIDGKKVCPHCAKQEGHEI